MGLWLVADEQGPRRSSNDQGEFYRAGQFLTDKGRNMASETS
ncbi:hypothetical protein [Streptacidiphilus sp. MAP5-52]